MKPSDIVAHLRKHCPALGQNVAAGINWDAVRDANKWHGVHAFVVPTDDKAGDPLYDNTLVQEIVEGIDVVVVWPQQDEPGRAVADEVSAMRRSLCLALAGFEPPRSAGWLIYEGRSFLHTDRAKVAYAFSFIRTMPWASSRCAAAPSRQQKSAAQAPYCTACTRPTSAMTALALCGCYPWQ